MTLIITRMVPSGIAMAADSTVTNEDRATGRVWAVPSSTKKLHAVTGLPAGVSAWGRGTINGTDTDQWIVDFIDRNKTVASVAGFASRLATELNTAFGNRLNGDPTIGFHVAGFEDSSAGLEPVFFHVHDGKSNRVANVDPRKINANNDYSSAVLKACYLKGESRTVRNGNFGPYAIISSALQQALEVLQTGGLVIPVSQDVSAIASFNVFEIRLMSDLYSMSSVVPGIGGRIDFLTIDCSGRITTGSRH